MTISKEIQIQQSVIDGKDSHLTCPCLSDEPNDDIGLCLQEGQNKEVSGNSENPSNVFSAHTGRETETTKPYFYFHVFLFYQQTKRCSFCRKTAKNMALWLMFMVKMVPLQHLSQMLHFRAQSVGLQSIRFDLIPDAHHCHHCPPPVTASGLF